MIPPGRTIESPDTLREIYAPAIERARLKSMRSLDGHCRRFIEKSPCICLSPQGHGGAIFARDRSAAATLFCTAAVPFDPNIRLV